MNRLMDVVLNGNGSSLVTRMKVQEEMTAELKKIVKGEREDEGLQYHMTRIRTSFWILQLEFGAGIAILTVILAWKH